MCLFYFHYSLVYLLLASTEGEYHVAEQLDLSLGHVGIAERGMAWTTHLLGGMSGYQVWY